MPDTGRAYMPRYAVDMISLVQWQQRVNPPVRTMAFISRKGSPSCDRKAQVHVQARSYLLLPSRLW